MRKPETEAILEALALLGRARVWRGFVAFEADAVGVDRWSRCFLSFALAADGFFAVHQAAGQLGLPPGHRDALIRAFDGQRAALRELVLTWLADQEVRHAHVA